MIRNLLKNKVIIIKQNVKKYSTFTSTNEVKNIVETEYDKARSYSSIPGPSIPQLIRAFLPGGEF